MCFKFTIELYIITPIEIIRFFLGTLRILQKEIGFTLGKAFLFFYLIFTCLSEGRALSHHICPACVALATASHARSPGQVAVAVPRAYLWLGGPVARNGFGIPGFLSSIASYAILPSSSPPLSRCMVSHSGNRREIACRLHFSASWEADVRQFLQTQEPDLAAAGLDLQEIHKSDLFFLFCASNRH